LGQQEALYWIKPLGLMEEDRKRLVTGDWLSDNHISAALKLLKKQYPHQNGLQSTQLLAKKLQWQSSNTDFVQILHISANHWVCASNVFSPPGVCDIFDSMPATYSSTLIRQVAAMMKTPNPSFTLRYINVQMQTGASDCGLFATAFTTALCARQDPYKCSFDQSQMRSHLYNCLQKGHVAEIPALTKPKRNTKSVKSTRSVQVYCTCRLPWDKCTNLYSNLAQCSKCKQWFHQNVHEHTQ